MSKLFENLQTGFEEIIAHEKGLIKLTTETFIIPEAPSEYSAKQIQKIRKAKNYSQALFAKVLNVSVKTVQSWESGQRNPSHAALRLLEIIDKGIYNPVIFKENKKKLSK